MAVQRGAFLSTLIVAFAIVTSLAGLAFLLSPGIEARLGHFPGWLNTYLVVSQLARLVALWAIWRWRRWGVYLFIVMEVAEVVLGIFVLSGDLAFRLTFPLRLMMGMALFLAVAVVWYLALRPKWHAFR